MQLTIFDVEHGACALLATDDGGHIMIDCGHNADTGWNPGDYLRNAGITLLDMLIITNYDEDHVSGLPELLESVHVKWLLRNRSVTPEIIQTLKSEDGMGTGIEYLVEMMKGYTPTDSPQPNFQGVSWEVFYHNYPSFDDENNLSLVLKLEINGIRFLFPGDIEKSGWKLLLEQNPRFREIVKSIDVFIASHHGRVSGYDPDLFTKYGCKPFWIVISDKGYEHETQETTKDYRQHARGGSFRGEERFVLSTRNDGHITFECGIGQWYALDGLPKPRRYRLI